VGRAVWSLWQQVGVFAPGIVIALTSSAAVLRADGANRHPALDQESEAGRRQPRCEPRQTFVRVISRHYCRRTLNGFALSSPKNGAAGIRSVVFIADIPMQTEIVPRLIVTKLQQFDYGGSSALAVVMRGHSFGMLLLLTCCSAGPAAADDSAALASVDYALPPSAAARSGTVSPRRQGATTEPPVGPFAADGLAMLYLVLFLILPLVAVFRLRRWQKGLGV